MWHKWNANIDDIMMTWFTLFANLVTSCLACAMSAYMHGTCALNKYGASKYWSGLACTQPDSNLGKITTSHFQVLNAQNANDCKCFDVEAISCVTVRSVVVFIDSVLCISDVVPTSDEDLGTIVV